MSVRYETSAAPTASPAPSPAAVAGIQATPTPRRRSSAHWAAPIPAPATTPPRTAADTESTRPATRWPITPATGKARATSSHRHHGRNDRRAAAGRWIESMLLVAVGAWWLMTGPFGWWCGWVLALIQATRTLSGWSTRWSRARASTRSASPATWATAIATTWRSRVVVGDARRPGAADRPESGANSAAATMVVTSSLVCGPLDDLGDGGGAAHRQLMDHVVGFGGHGCSVGGTPDTALSRRPRAYPAVVIAVSVLDVGRAAPRR